MLDPESVVRRLWNAINDRDYARVAGAIAETCEWKSMPTEQVYVGPKAMVDGVRAFHESFENGLTEIERIFVIGDVAVVEWRTSGTAVSGRSFARRGCAVAEVRGGKIAAYRDYFDRQSLADQLTDSP